MAESTHPPSDPAPTKATGPRTAPASFAQERLWLLHQLGGGSEAYHIRRAFTVRGALDAGALERALGELVRRHEALRTTLGEIDGAPVQVIAPFDGFALPVEDLSSLPEAEREAAARLRAGEAASRPFDLAAGPLFRALLLRLGAGEHVLALCVHHVVGDGWSLGVLFRELAALYAAHREGSDARLPPMRLRYADFAAWERKRLRGEALDARMAYWRQRLAGAPTLLELPADHPRPAMESARGAVVEAELSGELAERLRALGRREGASLFMVLLAAFDLLLSRYGAGDDMVVGTPIAGRTMEEVEGIVGFFANMLALRTDLSGDPAFREALRRVRAATLEAYDHQDVPFARVVAEVRPERSLAHSPLFQAVLSMDTDGPPRLELAGTETAPFSVEQAVSQYDLTLAISRSADAWRVQAQYRTELFERATVDRMLGHFRRVLEQVAGDADLRLSQVELMGDDERAFVLAECNRTDAEVPADRCIHHLMEEQARRTPDALAVVFEDDSLTYRELDERANRLARWLRRRGVGPEARVGICLERSLEMAVAVLGVLKAGGAYVPLDPGYPAERLAYVLDDSGVAVVLAQERLRAGLPASAGVDVVSLDAGWGEIAKEDAENPAVSVAPENAAYVIYTSGSTGRPKGVVNAHRGVVNRLCWMQAEYGIGAGDVVLHKTPVSFDVSVWELFWPLRTGATLVMARPDGHRDPAYLRDLIEDRGVTVLHFVPSMLAPFLETVDAGRCASLKRVICSGEALSPALVAAFHARFPDRVTLHNLYGPTEAAVDVSHWPCARGAETVPIGRPVWNTRLYVLDAALRPVPIGVAGELYIGGVQVARGYHDRPGMTAERFVPDPYSPGARLYRTGDRARWTDGAEVRGCEGAQPLTCERDSHDSDRTFAPSHPRTAVLHYLGRLDDQVKIRGFRVEPGEVEAALRRHPSVRECAVVARGDAPGERRLAAYVVGEADVDGLRAHLRRSLPEHMVPAVFVSLDRLPLTPSGKVDRKALPAPEPAPGDDRHGAPRTPVEEVLAAVWAEVLGLERVGAGESFFDLGGHSLLGMRVLSRVRDVFGVEMPLRALFAHPTVAGLAREVEALRGAAAAHLPAIVAAERVGPIPLSPGQERLWFLDRLEPETPLYNLPVALRLAGPLDADALARALAEIVRRHEALRTAFPEMDGVPVQIVAPPGRFALAAEDLSALGEAEREARAVDRAREEAARPFDLAAGPPFRALLLRLSADANVLVLCMHHVVADGWSLGVLFRELSALYGAYREGRDAALPEPPVRYADYAAWQRAHAEHEILARQLAWWKERLAGLVPLDLPADRPPADVEPHRGGTVSAELSGDLVERLRAMGRGEGATPFMVLLAAFQLVLARCAGSDDVAVGTPAAGRGRREVEGVIGFFLNTLVVRTDLSGDPTFRELLRRARAAALGAYEHGDVPFERVVAEARPERSAGQSPLFRVMFSAEDAPPDLALPGISAAHLPVDPDVARFDLSLLATTSGDAWSVRARYRAALFEHATVERMIARLERVLRQAAHDAEMRISRINLLGDDERRRVLEEWNRTDAEYPATPIHALIAAQATRTPEAVALVVGDDPLTYRQLDERANRLASHLAGLGAGPEARVAICLERSAGMVAAMLAALKAGAAYVPLDPAYPPERLAYMLEDSGAFVLVTQESLRGLLPAGGARVVSVDGDAALIAAEPAEAPRSSVAPENAAYAIYTSGSTGRPKGVVVTHANAAAFFAAMDERVGGAMPGTWLAVTRIGFDIHVLELLWTLARGFRVVVHPDADRAPGGWTPAREIRRHAVTHLQCTPSLAAMMIEESGVEALAGLDRLLLGGEALPADLAARISAALPGRLVNLYGPTETTVWSTTHAVAPAEAAVPIGRPIANTRAYVLDAALRPLPIGVAGELFIGGAGVARGYLDRPALTAERFVPDPFSAAPGARLYRTGDRARWTEGAEVRGCEGAKPLECEGDSRGSARTFAPSHPRTGVLHYLGRLDQQVKIRGVRVEPGEIEGALRRHEGVRDCAVVARGDESGETRLAAYVAGEADVEALRAHLRRSLPEPMVPAAFVFLDRLPLTPGGKLDRRALPAPSHTRPPDALAPRDAMEKRVADAWREVLGRDGIGVRDTFFDAGGSSFLLYRVFARLREIRGDLRVADLFRHPTVETLARHLAAGAAPDLARPTSSGDADRSGDVRRPTGGRRRRFAVRGRKTREMRGGDGGAIAVVGMSCRFPGARDAAEFWRNLAAGVESIAVFTEDELREAGVAPDLLADARYVRAHGALDDAYAFDAAFFGINPREAQVTDPQHRVFLECAWSALEDAGVDPARFAGAVGVYGGSGTTHHLRRVLAHPELAAAVGPQLAGFGNGKDFLTTRVSYRLGLRGPSVAVQTACSTSLVAIHMACRGLRSGECDLALAGGVTIVPDQVAGYLHQEGGILSPDGHCRAFDARAAGTVPGSGAGVVALKRLADALRDGDPIRAVVLGSAIDNDGAGKMAFTAPSAEGQARAIRAALKAARVDASTVTYVEAHGTGTALGDPIEVAALTEVFHASTERKGFCALGAVKTNVGHLDTAAGVAGFIKAVLALENRVVPPTLHFKSPNPETGLDGSPFFINTLLREWVTDGSPRRAGVSSFGFGGTNAHAVLEEAPARRPAPVADGDRLLVLSARSEAALERMRRNLAAHLAAHPDLPLADVAHTLQEGRAAHPLRWAAVAGSVEEARDALDGDAGRVTIGRAPDRAPPVAFLFPGQGTQYAGMARGAYGAHPVFRREVDRCAEALKGELGMDLRAVLFPAPGGEAEASELLRQTRVTQPALFVVEYALARLWMSWGVRPESIIGHSIGEYVAACIAGVFTVDAALKLVAARGRLVQALPAGAMLAVPLPEAEARPLATTRLSLAAVNGASHCVLSGDPAEIDRAEALLAGRGVAARRLHTSHAFHSAAMEPALDAFAAEVRRAAPAAPAIPFVSNVTGDWITAAQATDPAYWARHLRDTVRFADGVGRLLDDPARALLEVGPGDTLGTFARRHPACGERLVARTLPRAGDAEESGRSVLGALGSLWTAGAEVDWTAVRDAAPRRKVPLPTYPFERTIHRVPPPPRTPAASISGPDGFGLSSAQSSRSLDSALRASSAARSDVFVPSSAQSSRSSDSTLHPSSAAGAGVFVPSSAQSSRSADPSRLGGEMEIGEQPAHVSRTAARVAGLFADLLGTQAERIDPARSFLEHGADSLLLMQASRSVESAFGVRVPFRRLVEELSTVEALSAYLDREIPGDALPESPALPPSPSISTNHAVNGSDSLEAVARRLAALESHAEAMRADAAAMRREIELLRAGSPPARPDPRPAPQPMNGRRAPTEADSRSGSRGGIADAEGAPKPASHGPHRPVPQTLGAGGGFTERQARHFDELVRRYTARTRGSREYAARNRARLADNRASLNFRMATKELLYPIVGERSAGSRLWDVDGNEYVDFTMGFGVHFFGHRPAFVMEAVEEQLRRGVHLGPQSDLAGPVAELIGELTGMERSAFCNTGSEAVMTAVRVARAATGRDRIAIFEGAYHGCFDGVLARGAGGGAARPVAPGTPQGMVDDVVVLPFGAPQALDWLRAHGPTLAAVLVEPVQSRDPEHQPRAFLHEVRALTRRSGTALVFDEMITGFRLGSDGAQGWYGIEADLATYGKVIGGGFPLGVVAGRRELMDAVDGGAWSFGDDSYPAAGQTFFAGTFCKHPVAMSAARAVLLHLRERGPALYDEMNARAARLVAGLRAVLDEERVPIRVPRAASLFRFAPRRDDPFADLLFHHLVARGMYVWEGRACYLSTAHTDDDCDRLVHALRDSIHALRDGGFLPDGGASAGGSFSSRETPSPDPAAPFPLTPAQRAIHSHARRGDDGSRAYNEQVVFGVRGALDLGALRTAVDDLARHHDALRTVFDPTGDAQRVLPSLPTIPLRITDRVVDDDGLVTALEDAAREVFDLAAGPPFRLHVHARGPERHALQLVVHHLAADGVALNILRRDLEIAYRARRDGEAPHLPPAMQFSEYAALSAKGLQADAAREAEWLAGFEGATALVLPYDHPVPPSAPRRGARETRVLGAELADGVRDLARREECTPFVVLLGGMGSVARRLSGRDDGVIGISSAGRLHPGAESVVGCCADVLPLRVRAGEDLRALRGRVWDAVEHEAFSYARLVERTGAALPSLPSLVFNLEPGGSGGGEPTFAGLPVERVAAPVPGARYDLTIDAIEHRGAIHLLCTFDAARYERTTVARMLEALERVLREMAASTE